MQVRVSGYGGWFLLRLSLHDPVLPLNIEVSLSSLFFHLSTPRKHHFVIWQSCNMRMQAQSKDAAIKLGLAVLAAVSEFSALDTSALNKFLQKWKVWTSNHWSICSLRMVSCSSMLSWIWIKSNSIMQRVLKCGHIYVTLFLRGICIPYLPSVW